MSLTMLRSIFIVSLVFSGTSYAADCSLIKNSASRLACYDSNAKQSDMNKIEVGTVEGTVTWQYNKFVGTKGDNGATVILVRLPVEDTIAKLSDSDRDLLGRGLDSGSVYVSADGIYEIKVDGFGKFSKDGILVGRYLTIVTSGSTSPSPDDVYTQSCTSRLKEFFNDIRFFRKAYCTSVQIKSGERSQIVHDFGNTYF